MTIRLALFVALLAFSTPVAYPLAPPTHRKDTATAEVLTSRGFTSGEKGDIAAALKAKGNR